ncbi:CopD family protein [Siphonobacter aquaeclarae]|uniref:Protoporphyrinogen IX oxidase n=1 Tax=Siphonobacter aquaeclarae TaxID=563176 RepID=A0A1G9R1L3_9BACT|nr:CopD family protein [Siphonobacter aquaeclarae]SDM17128.1 putative membrane protein [Siphonobacter aquaeclarae]
MPFPYEYLKSLHIIFVVSWFAGLFYLPRLFIYHTEANDKPEPAREILLAEYRRNEKLLFNAIMIPAMWLTLLSATWMLYLFPYWLQQSWMHLKLLFVAGVIGYHFYCRKLLLELRENRFRHSSPQLRLWNEVATILLFAIVFLVVLKNALDWIYGVAGIIAFAVLLMTAVRMVKRLRERKKENGR